MPIFILKQTPARRNRFRETESIVVRAASETAARKVAHTKGSRFDEFWLDHELSTCEVVRLSGPPEVIQEVVHNIDID